MDRQSVYKSYKNKLNRSFSADSTTSILREEIEQRSIDTRATWKVLNEILNRSKRNSNRCSTFEANDREITDPVEIANKFCSYF